MSVYFMSCHGFRNNNMMFKQSEAHDVERVAYLFSINVLVEKNFKKADKINWGHF